MPNRHILVIDDDPGICQVVQIAFKVITHWEVLIATSSQTGIALAEAEQPDAILLDVMMPKEDGLVTLGKIQKTPKIQSIPIILLTAKTQSKDLAKFAQLSVAGVITKPFKAATLVSQVRDLLKWGE